MLGDYEISVLPLTTLNCLGLFVDRVKNLLDKCCRKYNLSQSVAGGKAGNTLHFELDNFYSKAEDIFYNVT